MKSKRILPVWLASLLLVSTFVSCSGEPNTTPEDTTVSTTSVVETTNVPIETADPRLADELPERCDWKGYDFTVLTNLMPESEVDWKIIDVVAEEETGERINDAVYARNLAMTERFNVNVVMDAKDNAPESRAEIDIMAGVDSFTVISAHSQVQGGLAVKGLLANLNSIDYLNFNKAWWDTDAILPSAIGGRIYQAGGSATLNTFKATWCVLFNKDLVQNAGLPDLYQSVRDGDWTIDLLKEYGKKLSKDVDGDGSWEFGVDTYGVLYQYEILLSLFQGYGAKIIEVKNDGSFDIVMDSPKAMQVMEKVYRFMHEDADYMLNVETATVSGDRWVEAKQRFKEGKAGFFMTNLAAPTLITDMQSDFGILPFPKLDKTQEQYASAYQYNCYFTLAVPKTAENLDRTGMLTEAYTMLAHDTVREAWKEYTLTLRTARDNESGEMLDIIFSGRGFDLSLLYNSTTQAQKILQNVMKEPSFTYASTVASSKASIETAMRTVIDAINTLDV